MSWGWVGGQKLPNGRYPHIVPSLRRGDVVRQAQRLCRVVEVWQSQAGRHGGLKILYRGVDLFNGSEMEWIASKYEGRGMRRAAFCSVAATLLICWQRITGARLPSHVAELILGWALPEQN